eukprot:4426791-Karenia_brevis.AAC.1
MSYQLPIGLQNLIFSLFEDVSAFVEGGDGAREFLFLIQSGIGQGCPLSGAMRACADDLASLIYDLHTLKLMHKAFKIVEQSSGLCLSVGKLCFIPVNMSCNNALLCDLRRWLWENIPDWHGVEISGWGIYLGIPVGPVAHFNIFAKTIQKYIERSHMLTMALLAPSLNTIAYNSMVMTVLGHILQLHDPSIVLLQTEKRMIHSVLRLPYNTFAAGEYFGTIPLFGFACRSIEATAFASQIRVYLQQRSLVDLL